MNMPRECLRCGPIGGCVCNGEDYRLQEAERALRRSPCSCWDHTCARCAYLDKYELRETRRR